MSRRIFAGYRFPQHMGEREDDSQRLLFSRLLAPDARFSSNSSSSYSSQSSFFSLPFWSQLPRTEYNTSLSLSFFLFSAIFPYFLIFLSIVAGIERNSRRELMAAVIHENYYGWWVRVHTCRPTDVVHNVCLSLEHQQRERERAIRQSLLSASLFPFVCVKTWTILLV